MSAKVRAESSCSSVFGDIERSRFFKLWPLLTFEQVVGSRRYMSSKLNNANRLKKKSFRINITSQHTFLKRQLCKIKKLKIHTEIMCAQLQRKPVQRNVFCWSLDRKKSPNIYCLSTINKVQTSCNLFWVGHEEVLEGTIICV